MRSILLFLFTLISLVCLSQPGSTVTGFGSNGKVITPVSSGTDHMLGLAVQPDGKIIAVGVTASGSENHLALIRYNTDGSLDNTFGASGIVTTAFAGSNNSFAELVLQPDGKIIVAGHTQSSTSTDFLLLRFLPNGTLDNTFDGDGIVITPAGTAGDYAVDVALQPDGKIVAGGRGFFSNIDFAIVRYNTDGSLDNTFDSDGIAYVTIGIAADDLQAIAIQPDGKIVAVGYSSITEGMSTSIDVVVVRLNADGMLDNSFSGDGKLTTAVGTSNDNAYDVAIQPDGKIVLVGSTAGFLNYDIMLIRYNADGSLDNSFDSDGKLVIDLTTQDHFRNIALQNDGKIVVSGDVGPDIIQDQQFAVVRINSNGTLDNSFGSNGSATMSVSSISANKAGAMAVTNDRIYVGGYTAANGNDDFVITAFNNNASALSVKLLAFNGSQSNGTAILDWKISGDLYGSTIELQKANDGKEFNTITQYSINNSATESGYTYDDNNFAGVAYYRLRILEKTGTVIYSKVLILGKPNAVALSIYPNPAKGNIFLRTSSEGKLDVRLMNSSGKQMKAFAIQALPNSVNMLDVSGISKGMYILVIHSIGGITTLPVILE